MRLLFPLWDLRDRRDGRGRTFGELPLSMPDAAEPFSTTPEVPLIPWLNSPRFWEEESLVDTDVGT